MKEWRLLIERKGGGPPVILESIGIEDPGSPFVTFVVSCARCEQRLSQSTYDTRNMEQAIAHLRWAAEDATVAKAHECCPT